MSVYTPPDTSGPGARGASGSRIEAVRASAGSGKTYELTSRYLKSLVNKAPVEQILATTFTRKAAGEILERVLKRLAASVLEPTRAQELAEAIERPTLSQAQFSEYLMALVQNLHRINISTIDSFFNRLAGSFRYELELPVELKLLDQASPLALQMRLDAIRALLSTEAEIIPLIEGWLRQRPVRSITGALDREVQQLYEVFRQTRLEDWARLQVAPGPTPEQLERAQDVVADALSRASGMLQKALQKVIERLQAQDTKELLKDGLVAIVVGGSDSYSRKPIDPPLLAALQVLGQYAQTSVLDALAAQTRATGTLLHHFDRHYSAIRKEHGVVLFADLPLQLSRRAALLEQDPVAHRLDTPIRHLLLDEFQDTSPEQWAVLLPVATQVVEQRGSLFCVGDVKQAIYGWRGGVAEIFNQLQVDLPSLQWSVRARSYRSSQVVLDAVNEVFQHLTLAECLKEHAGVTQRWQAGYEPHEAVHRLPGYVLLKVGPGVQEESEEGDEEPLTQAGALEVQAAAEVAALARQHPDKSIGVLVRTNDAVRRLLFLLQKQSVDASGEGGNPIVDDPGVEVILAAFQLADHPGDGIASWRLRESPLKPLLLALAGLEAQGWSNTRVGSAIRRTVLERGLGPLISDWSVALAPISTPRTVRRLLQLVELAERFDPERGLRVSEFVSYVRAATVEEPSPARVRVMTVHKSKGLEFDLVYLLELHKRLLQSTPAVLIDRPDPTQPVRAVYRFAGKEIRALDAGLQAAYAQHLQREVSEGLCELYVAMTRARFALHMMVPARKATKTGLARAPLSHAAILRGTLRNQEVEETSEGGCVLFEAGDPLWSASLPLRPTSRSEGEGEATPSGPPGGFSGRSGEGEPWAIRLAPAGVPLRGYRRVQPSGLEQEASVHIDELLRTDEDPVLKQGIIFHAWMQHIRWLDQDGEPSDALLEALAREQGLTREGPGLRFPDGSHLGLPELVRRFRGMLRARPIREALSRPALEPGELVQLWLERPFVIRLDARIMQGSFDRAEVYYHGGKPIRAQVLDYKSDAVVLDEGGRRFLQQRLERYRPQLQAYRQALSHMVQLPLEQVGAQILWLQAGMVSVI